MKRLWIITGMTLALATVGCGSSTDGASTADTSTGTAATSASTTSTTTTADTTTAAATESPPAAPTGTPAATVAARLEVSGDATNTTTNSTIPLNPGWNAVGLDCQHVTAVDPGAGVAGMASYDGTGYTVGSLDLASLNQGDGARRGFFVYATQATNLTYAGTDDGQGDYVDLRAGWNLVSFNLNADLPCNRLQPGDPPPGASPGGSPRALPSPDGSPRVRPSPGTGLFPEGSPRPQPSPGATPSGSPRTLGEVVLTTFYELAGNGQTTPVNTDGGSVRPGRPYWVYSQRPTRLNRPHQPTPGASPAASPQ